ncbi:LTA synthase family protein [Alkalicoccus chagannorensis]|uniref:LTA synthase family protein n=1 Tax=Alkalicoccus chagannorensis TaxID=427072 RepID=UPI00047EE368|nr:LTA synthase family protein [Alkalicoccus chagannorensis]
MKELVSKHRFMILCLLLLWVKTVTVSFLTFDLLFQNWFEVLLFSINPLAFLLIVFSVGLLLRPSWQRPYFFAVSAVLAGVLYANTVYYREFADMITLPMLVMSGNMGDLSTSIVELVHWWDIIFFADLIVIGWMMVKKPAFLTVEQIRFPRYKWSYAAVAGFTVLVILLGQVETTEEETPNPPFDRSHLIKSLGIYHFYFYDAYLQLTTGAQPVTAEREDLDDTEAHLEEYSVTPSEDMHGAAEDKNIVVISLESVESFALEQTVDGEPVTPFLNELIEESFYFDEFYDQAGQGKTSDTEFMMNNSLYPVGRGAVFHTHPDNDLTPLPRALSDMGYYNAAFHANDDTFYNRDNVYPHLGYDYYYDVDYYDVTDDNSVGWGLKDIPFFEQSMPYVEELDEPFYATFLTLTNHFPYELDYPEDYFIPAADTESDIVNRYFPAVRYTDEAVRHLFQQFEEAGLYEDTIFLLYGDHYGIAESHYDELASFLGEPIGPYETVKLDRVPFIVHIPGMEDEAETISTVGGHIDMMPTLENLIGGTPEDHVMFGRDLFSEERDDFAVLRNGNVVTDEIVYNGELCFDAETGEELEMSACLDDAERGEMELEYSDEIIYGDLLRFLHD